MAAGGNVEVVWSNLVKYLSPSAPQELGIKSTYHVKCLIFSVNCLFYFFQGLAGLWNS